MGSGQIKKEKEAKWCDGFKVRTIENLKELVRLEPKIPSLVRGADRCENTKTDLLHLQSTGSVLQD